MDLELRELIDEYREACDMPIKPKEIKLLPENYIQDEDKSVKWNKEYVKQHNIKYQEEVHKINKERDLAIDFAIEEIKQYIIDEAKVTQKTAQKIFDFSYDKANNLYEIGYYIEDLIDLFWD